MNGWLPAGVSGKAGGLMAEQREIFCDTNCLIDIYRGRLFVRSVFDAILHRELIPHISVITEAELWRGLRAIEVERHEALLAHFVIVPLRSDAAWVAGTWMQQYAEVGLGWMDALITATASTVGLPLLTRDARLASVLATQATFELYLP